ncbi:hypothetical protein Pfo_028862 [Paulownia fortunei]|nr:hypothetical protein Pfo_028862 [Paulownia fortunei]
MAFSSCLKCHPWTPSHNLNHPFLCHRNSKPAKVTSFPFSRIYAEQPPTLSFAVSSGLSSILLSPDFTPKQLLDTLRREEDENSALRLFQWASKQPNFATTLPIYEEIIRKLGNVGSFDSVRQVLDDMKHSEVEIVEGTFFILIDSYAKFELYDEAVDVLHVMEIEFGVRPGTHTYNFLLNVLVDGNKLILVESVHSKMLDDGVKPDVSTFNILIKALCKAHQIRPAILLMEEMPNYGFSNLGGALRVREQMVAAQCPWSNVTINVLINGFCKEGRVEEALIFVQEMANEGFCPDHFTFNTLISGLCKVGHVNHALEILDLMLQEGFDPDVFTYNTVISGLCKWREVEEAMEVLNQMLSRDCSPNAVTYNAIISTLCKENQQCVLPDVSTFNSLIQGLCLTSKFSIAMELFFEMKTKGCQPDEFTYNILIDCLCTKGKLDEALRLLKDMESSGCARSVITYNTLIDGFCKSKKIEEAEEIFDEMELQGVSRNLVTYNTLIDGLCKCKRCCDLWHPNSGLCKAGRIEVATRLLRSIQMKGMVLTPQAYNPVIQALLKRKRIKEAMRLFREMEEKSDPPDAISYKLFSEDFFGGGPIGEAVDFALEMTEKGHLPEFSSFYMLAEGLCALNMEETLVKLIDKVAMVMGFLKIRKFPDALATFGRVLNSRKPKKGYW